MAKQRTDSSRFPSNYGGGWVSPGQYLVECLCVLIAKTEKKELQDRFWQQEPWKQVFRRQVPLAVELLKQYDVNVVLSAMRDRRCWKIRSFGAKWLLEPLLKEKQRIYDAELARAKNRVMKKASTVDQPRKPISGRKSLLSSLKEVDNVN